MKLLEKIIRREIRFKSGIRGFPERSWIVSIGPGGIRVRKKGSADERWIDWYKLVGWLIVHGNRSILSQLGIEKPAAPAERKVTA